MQEKTELKERLLLFLKDLGIGQAKFAENVGVSRGFVNNIGGSIRTDILEKIVETYPQLNVVWLLLGEGEMLKGSVNMPNIKNKGTVEGSIITGNTVTVQNDPVYLQQEVNYLKREIELKDRELEMFKDNIERIQRIQEDADKAKEISVGLYERKIGDLKDLIKVLKTDIEILRKQVDFYNSMKK